MLTNYLTMSKSRLFFGQVILILGIYLVTITDAGMIMMTNISCSNDESLCLNSICVLTPVRKGIQFMNFACYLEKKQDNLLFRVKLSKLGNGGRKIIDTTEDYCKVTANAGTSSAMARLFPSIQKHGTLFSKCPLIGNITLMRYPVDFSFVPIVMTPGNYRLTGMFLQKDNPNGKHLIHGNLDFTVRDIFKKH